MMTDIVERLRKNSRITSYRPLVDELILEAADEIERLRAENERVTQTNAGLFAVIESLRAEVEKLDALNQQVAHTALEIDRENESLRAEVAAGLARRALRAEVARLREAMANVIARVEADPEDERDEAALDAAHIARRALQ